MWTRTHGCFEDGGVDIHSWGGCGVVREWGVASALDHGSASHVRDLKLPAGSSIVWLNCWQASKDIDWESLTMML